MFPWIWEAPEGSARLRERLVIAGGFAQVGGRAVGRGGKGNADQWFP